MLYLAGLNSLSSDLIGAGRVDGAKGWNMLRHHGEYGVEAQFFRRGEFLYGRRFDLKAQALQWAELERQTLERDGWQRCELPTSRNEDGS